MLQDKHALIRVLVTIFCSYRTYCFMFLRVIHRDQLQTLTPVVFGFRHSNSLKRTSSQHFAMMMMLRCFNTRIVHRFGYRASSSLSSVWNPTEEHLALRETLRSFVKKEVSDRILIVL